MLWQGPDHQRRPQRQKTTDDHSAAKAPRETCARPQRETFMANEASHFQACRS